LNDEIGEPHARMRLLASPRRGEAEVDVVIVVVVVP
jgi:hypothetical protein